VLVVLRVGLRIFKKEEPRLPDTISWKAMAFPVGTPAR